MHPCTGLPAAIIIITVARRVPLFRPAIIIITAARRVPLFRPAIIIITVSRCVPLFRLALIIITVARRVPLIMPACYYKLISTQETLQNLFRRRAATSSIQKSFF